MIKTPAKMRKMMLGSTPIDAATWTLGASVEMRMPMPTEASAMTPQMARKRPYLGSVCVKSMIQKMSVPKIVGPNKLRGISERNLLRK